MDKLYQMTQNKKIVELLYFKGKMGKHGNIIIYKDKNGNDNIEVKLQDNTVWLNQ